MFPRWGITYLINLSPRTFITYVFPRSFPTKYITKLRMKYQSDVISLYLIFRSPVFPRCFPGVSPLLIIIMKSKSVGCHFIIMIFIDFPRCFPGVSPVFIIIPASALRFGAASLEMQRTLLCAMHSRLCVDPRRSSPAQARIHMTRGWAVESGGSTSCEWKEGGNAACSALVNCPTVHEAAKWDSPRCPRQRQR